MQLLVLVLNHVECLDDLLSQFAVAGIKATVLDSKGMVRMLNDSEGLSILGSLRLMLNPDQKESKTIFTVLQDDKVEQARLMINQITGGFNMQNTGILFSVPVLFAEGMNK